MIRKNEELITLTKSDLEWLIAMAAGYAWNEAGAYREGLEGYNNVKKEKEKLLEWAITRNQNKNEHTR